MTLKITKGKRTVPVRGVLYGTAGIGKSTFGAGLPRPLFLDTEESTNQLDVDRVLVTSWAALGAAVAEIASGSHDYQTVVIDTADWAERLPVESILAKHNQKSIEGFGYGKGYTILAEEFGRFLQLCDGLVSKAEQVVNTAIQEDVDAIGLSILSGAHKTLCARVIELLKERGAEDIAVFGGGIIPDYDLPLLKAAGVRALFRPGAPMGEIVEFVKGLKMQK